MTTIPPTTQTSAPRAAGPGDRQALNGVFAAAFADDPVFAWLIPDRDELVAVLPTVFDAFADAFARHDATHLVDGDGTASEAVGAALWAPPGVEPVHPDDEDRLGERLAEACGPHMDRMATCMEVFGAAHPDEPVWFLQFLGVDPGHQGRGHGSTLLRAVLDAADRAGEAAYLDATSPQNRRLYERHGFRTVGDLVLPDGPTVYAMWRSPAT
jgi:ribosomal protein S18 acetylase RimI-like enzyme